MNTINKRVLNLNLIVINIIAIANLVLIKKRRPRKFWIRNIFKQRKSQGDYHNLLQEMRLSDSERYFNYLRMSSDTFNKLLAIVGPSITKIYHTREPISPAERLALTLRYLASGDSMISISYAFRIGSSTVSQIIKETCEALWNCLHKIVLLTPTEESWLQIANDFSNKWQVPNCVGAIDGKHVIIEAPAKSGSTYFNYKGHHSIVLLALCDANYKFTLVDIGAEGRHSDGGVFKNSNIGKGILNDNIHFPPPSHIDYDGDPLNHYIIADEAFPLCSKIMRPYPGRFLPLYKKIFNYRLSRARRVIENTFGILSAKWRIFRKPIVAGLPTIHNIIKATVCLHNFLIDTESTVTNESKHYCPSNLVDREDAHGCIIEGDWLTGDSQNLLPLTRVGSNMYGKNADNMRNELSSYFMFDGAVSFQWDK